MYIEPYGSPLRSSAALSKAFSQDMPEGWTISSIEVKLQTDGYNCGVWIVVLDEAILAYIASTNFATAGAAGFSGHLADWLATRGISDLRRLAAGKSRVAGAANLKFISEKRCEMRELLLAAAHAGKLDSYRDGSRFELFAGKGRAAPTPEEEDVEPRDLQM